MKALVFDFDGLIIDTELAEYETWREIYAEHGAELKLDVWTDVVGSAIGYFDPVAHLEGLIGRPLDKEALAETRRKRTLERIVTLPILPGIEDYIATAKQRGMKLAVASNSDTNWVEGHLARIGLLSCFEAVLCVNHVKAPKPAPELYLAALNALAVQPDEAIAFEDSPHGIAAARAAAMFTVAVPNSLTAGLDLGAASIVVSSLAELPFDDLLALARSAAR